jgi:hypothetical protein
LALRVAGRLIYRPATTREKLPIRAVEGALQAIVCKLNKAHSRGPRTSLLDKK